MSLAELRPLIKILPSSDKFRLVQELVAELAQEEGLTEGEYPVWSPYDAHEAAATLMQLVEQDKAKPIILASYSEALRPFGLCAGEFVVPDEFDVPLPDAILADFEGV